MTLSLDGVDLVVPEVPAARAFYAAALAAAERSGRPCVTLDLGAGKLGLRDAGPRADAGPPGCVLNYVVAQPSEVQAVLEAAVRHGAEVLKPARKGFFGGFTAVLRAPDGSVWKLAAPTKRDTAPAAAPPVPTETVVLLGVADPQASAAFYAALGMTVDRDYGGKFVDFRFEPGTSRLGLMPRRELAKDAGADPDALAAVVLTRRAGSRDEVDALLAAAAAAGGHVVVPTGADGRGGWCGRFTDPDGFLWEVTAG